MTELVTTNSGTSQSPVGLRSAIHSLVSGLFDFLAEFKPCLRALPVILCSNRIQSSRIDRPGWIAARAAMAMMSPALITRLKRARPGQASGVIQPKEKQPEAGNNQHANPPLVATA